MMIEIVLASGVAVVCIIYVLSKKTKPVKELTPPPGPPQSLLLGNFKDIDAQKVHQSLHKLFTKYGPIVNLRLLKRNIVILNSGEVIRKAFETEEFKDALNDKPVGFYGTYLVYGHKDILLGPYCERTFQLKEVMHKGLVPVMDRQRIEQEAETLVERIAKHGNEDFFPADIVETLLAEVFSVLISGESKPTDAEILWDFVNWSNKLLNPSVETLLKNFPFLRHLPGKHGFLFNVARQKRDRLLKRYLDETKESFKEGVTRSLVDTCLKVQNEEKDVSGEPWLSDDMIRALILDTIGGGLVTTTNTILATVLNLLHHRACADKMADEIQRSIGKGDTAGTSTTTMMPFCHAVILETQRLSSLVPVVSHLCSKEDVEFEGYSIKKGTMVWGNIWSAHHNEGSWSEPWKFMPERFLDDNGELRSKNDPLLKEFLPLGVGSRYCPGSDFSMHRIFAYVTKIVRNFDILPPKEGELVSFDPCTFTAGAVLQLQSFSCRMVKR